MRLRALHHLFIQEGQRQDVRSPVQIRAFLAEQRRLFRTLKGISRKFFDKEDLTNPYADTRILCGDPNQDIKTILAGIDIGVGELMWAQHLWQGGRAIDLVLSHHPQGAGLAGLPQVMALQIDWLVQQGLEPRVAKELMTKRMEEVSRSVHSENHMRVVDIARAMPVAFACCHTPADNHVAAYLQRVMDSRQPQTLAQVVDLLLQEPEYQLAAQGKSGPRIIVGQPQDPAGKIVIDMTGGTEGSRDIFARLSQAGVKTVIGMHMSEAHVKQVKNEYVHVIIAGHIASDNLGMNLLFDRVQKRFRDVEIIPCSGFYRVRR